MGAPSQPSKINRVPLANLNVGISGSLKDALQAVAHTPGSPVTITIKYLFQKAVDNLEGNKAMNYGTGRMEFAALEFEENHRLFIPIDALGLEVALQARFATDEITLDIRPGQTKGFKVPWNAEIFLSTTPKSNQKLALASAVSIYMCFICPDGPQGTVRFNFLDRTSRSTKEVNLAGVTHSECCRPLGIFHEASVFLEYKLAWLDCVALGMAGAAVPAPRVAVQPPSKSVNIKVWIMGGTEMALQVKETMTVESFRKLVGDRLGIPASELRLQYDGLSMCSDNTLASYGVVDGDIFDVTTPQVGC